MIDDDAGGRVPGWFVTFSDMMALLLTFFVMLVSFSELKSEEKYQALVDGFQQKFGDHDSQKNVIPGQMRPRNSNLSKMVSVGRTQRQEILQCKSQVPSGIGDSDQIETFVAGPKPGAGTILYFQENQIELDEEQRALLRQHADVLRGKSQKVEIRGHTSNRRSQPGTHVRDNWDLSFERCRRVMQYLVEDQQIDSRTLRISAAAANEPLPIGTSHDEPQKNSRVELYLLDEAIEDTSSI